MGSDSLVPIIRVLRPSGSMKTNLPKSTPFLPQAEVSCMAWLNISPSSSPHFKNLIHSTCLGQKHFSSRSAWFRKSAPNYDRCSVRQAPLANRGPSEIKADWTRQNCSRPWSDLDYGLRYSFQFLNRAYQARCFHCEFFRRRSHHQPYEQQPEGLKSK